MAFGAADGKVIIDTHLNNNGFVKGVKGLKGELGGLKTVVRQFGTIVASAFAVRTLVNFGKECVELGSNVAEVQNVVDTAFGDMTYKVESFADKAIQNFGMSRLAAKKTASTYMAMAKGMGIADEAASDMSITLAGLTGDVASFYNISQELADTKLKSVFTGETETLKDLGVVMTQDNLKAYALSQGITKSYDAMTQAEKVALRYNYVLDSLALAQGDFAKTSDSWANQTRILSMQWQEFMSIIGQALVRVLTPCVKVLNQIVSSLISIANTVNTVVANLFGGQNTQIENATAVGDAISGAVDNQNALTEATEETAKAQKSTLAGFDEINKLGGESSSGSSSSTGGALAVAGGTTTYEVDVEMAPASERILAFFDELKTAAQPAVDALGRLKTASAPLTEGLFSGLAWAMENVFKPLGAWAGGEVLPAFLDVLAGGCDLLSEAIDVLAPWGSWLWEEFLQPLASWTGGVIVTVLGEISDLLKDISDVISGDTSFGDFITNLTPAQTALMGIATAITAIAVASAGLTGLSLITGFVKGIQSLNAVGIIGKLAEVVLLTAGGAGTLSEAMKAVFGPGSIIAGIAAVIGGAVVAVTNFISMLKNGFSWANEALMLLGIALTAVGAIILGAPALVAGVIAGIVAAVATAVVVIKDNWESVKAFFVDAWEAIKGVWSAVSGWFTEHVIDPITEAFKKFINGLIGFVEGFINFFVRGINKIIDAANSLSFDIPEILGGGTIGFDLARVSEIKLPRLATGAVIPPNREFLAVLGDQRSGTNIEAPLSTIEQAVENVLNRRGTGGGMTLTVKAAPGLTRYLKYELDAESTRRGGKLTQGGTA